MTGSLTEALRARVVSRDGSGTYRFAHDLFREYAYEQLPAAERAALHQRIGGQLEARRARGGDVSLAELARHFVQADPASPAAGRYSVAAAREAACASPTRKRYGTGSTHSAPRARARPR